MLANSGLSKEVFIDRLTSTQKSMTQMGLDGLIALSSFQEREGHVVYLTNHHIAFPNIMSHAGLGYAAIVLPVVGNGALVAPFGCEAENLANVDKIYEGPDLVTGLLAAVKQKKLEGGKIGLAGTDVLPAEYFNRLTAALPGAGFVTADAILESLRMAKSVQEVELLREAAGVVDVALQAGLGAIRAGISQIEVEEIIRRAAMQAGADFVARVRVSSGSHISALKWPMAGAQTLENGDFVFMDVIGWRKNYGFDASRVTVVGKPTAEQVDYLEHMIEATQWMIDEMKPDRGFRFSLTESRGRTIQVAAHGIGLEICENPWITAGKDFVLTPGMVLCVEPQVISKQFGGMAVEEIVLVTDNGAELLTHCPLKTW
jgi:Xaa-Pro aminopeptidase